MDAVCLDRQDGECTIRTLTGRIGGATPLGLGPGSTTILAHLPEDERREVLAANAPRITALGHLPPLERDLQSIRERGYSYEVSAAIAGVVGLAVPILTPRGRPLAAIAIGATEARLSRERSRAVLEMMCEEASGIAAHLEQEYRGFTVSVQR